MIALIAEKEGTMRVNADYIPRLNNLIEPHLDIFTRDDGSSLSSTTGGKSEGHIVRRVDLPEKVNRKTYSLSRETPR